MTQPLIDSIRRAWVEGLEEFLSTDPVGGKSLLPNLTAVIGNIRIHQLLREGKNESYVRRVYDDIRNIPDFYTLFMSAVSAFMLQLDQPHAAMEYFSNRVEVYTDKSGVVDATTLSRRAPTGTLLAILTENPWLFMLLVASTHERDTIAVLVKHGLKK
ncbi:hypothetical protein [Pseudomonas phage D6]|nr:hypothetical protein [Pseudomonas phage D6]